MSQRLLVADSRLLIALGRLGMLGLLVRARQLRFVEPVRPLTEQLLASDHHLGRPLVDGSLTSLRESLSTVRGRFSDLNALPFSAPGLAASLV